jgi:hypothetical protein
MGDHFAWSEIAAARGKALSDSPNCDHERLDYYLTLDMAEDFATIWRSKTSDRA